MGGGAAYCNPQEHPISVSLDTITCSDTLEYLQSLPDGIVQTCITSPPYWSLRDYGVEGQLGLEPTIDEYIANMTAVFTEVRRVLRDDGTCWLNMGDAYFGAPGGNQGQTGQRADRTFTARVSDKRVPGLKPKDLIGQPWRLAFALQNDGWYLRSDIIWAKPNPMPESVTDRPTKSHEYVFLLSKSQRYFYDAEAIRETSTFDGRPRGGRDYIDYRDSNSEFKDYHAGRTQRMNAPLPDMSTRNKRTVWTIPTEPYPEAHFATFPQKLVEPCILAGSKAGDIVLDPFMGSGTTALVALRLNRHFLGCDLNSEYVEMANRRISEVQPQLITCSVNQFGGGK